jgi:hypothetical protein
LSIYLESCGEFIPVLKIGRIVWAYI